MVNKTLLLLLQPLLKPLLQPLLQPLLKSLLQSLLKPLQPLLLLQRHDQHNQHVSSRCCLSNLRGILRPELVAALGVSAELLIVYHKDRWRKCLLIFQWL
jgi:hypothetical protein